MNLGLENKIAIVTGSSKGLGFATALQLAKEGVKVVICSSNQENVDEAVSKIQNEIETPNNVSGAIIDLSTTDHIESFVNDQAKKHGGLDILVCNTAGPKAGTFDDIQLDDLTQSYHKVMAPMFALIKASQPYLEKSDSGAILTITSMSAKQPIQGLMTSNILRPGIAAFSKNLSQELGPKGIRVNSILPGWISTDRSKAILASDANSFSQDTIEQDIPLGRIGTPEEFGNVATFLVSPAASYVNGVSMQVDGGSIVGLS